MQATVAATCQMRLLNPFEVSGLDDPDGHDPDLIIRDRSSDQFTSQAACTVESGAAVRFGSFLAEYFKAKRLSALSIRPGIGQISRLFHTTRNVAGGGDIHGMLMSAYEWRFALCVSPAGLPGDGQSAKREAALLIIREIDHMLEVVQALTASQALPELERSLIAAREEAVQALDGIMNTIASSEAHDH